MINGKPELALKKIQNIVYDQPFMFFARERFHFDFE